MKLVTYPDSRLNQVSEEVTKEDLPQVVESIKSMTKIMKDHNGVGLAAVQVGILKRYALLDLTKDTYKDPQAPNCLLLINPTILKQEDSVRMTESCLSLPRYNQLTDRYSSIEVAFKDENWDDKVLSFKGLLAQCIQHEIGHFDGKLLTDTLSKMKMDMYIKSLKKRGII